MAKPIFIVGLPLDQRIKRDESQKSLEDKIGEDYYCLAYVDSNLKEPKFQVFYEKDFNEVKYEELKKIIEDALK
jgi:hypothetical protein